MKRIEQVSVTEAHCRSGAVVGDSGASEHAHAQSSTHTQRPHHESPTTRTRPTVRVHSGKKTIADQGHIKANCPRTPPSPQSDQLRNASRLAQPCMRSNTVHHNPSRVAQAINANHVWTCASRAAQCPRHVDEHAAFHRQPPSALPSASAKSLIHQALQMPP
jgi:hypothetical protein